MLKVLLLLACFTFAGIFSAPTYQSDINSNGYLDTASIDSNKGTLKRYTSAFPLNTYESIRVNVLCDDTSSEGFADDSVKFAWGYQVFSLCLNYAGAVDTCLGVEYVVDTVSKDSFGTARVRLLNYNAGLIAPGSELASNRNIDTLVCAGFAVQSKTIYPSDASYIRFWTQGIATNKTLARVKTRFSLNRKVNINVRTR